MCKQSQCSKEGLNNRLCSKTLGNPELLWGEVKKGIRITAVRIRSVGPVEGRVAQLERGPETQAEGRLC